MISATSQAAQLMLGDEAVAKAAVDSGVGAAYGYPGTPSTEILESLIRTQKEEGGFVAQWCSNEKTAYEQALGASLAGKRALVTMKHVGLNVAADPFVNSVLLRLRAGFVLAVADDPGMHSSQNEQDSRFYAEFARAVCLEPSNQQEAYDMTRDAFQLSEALGKPVVVRLVTRIAHSRAIVRSAPPQDAISNAEPVTWRRGSQADLQSGWTLVPSNSRKLWRDVVEAAASESNSLVAAHRNRVIDSGSSSSNSDGLAVITAGVGRNYFDECAAELAEKPIHIHIGHYPINPELVSGLPDQAGRILVVEDGYPFVERWIKGIVGPGTDVLGRETGQLPATGELTADGVRLALDLPLRSQVADRVNLPARAPQLCQGCPHSDSFAMISEARGDKQTVVTSDIGCYALGGLPPHSTVDSIVCMGASIGMAKGAADAGEERVVATIGDSTFLHSGISSLLDAAQRNTPMTVIILDNATVAMTGGQPTAAETGSLERIVLGLGVSPEHVVTLKPIRTAATDNAEALEKEMDYEGLSVIIARRNCIKIRPTKTEKSE